MSDGALDLYECCGHCSDRHREHKHRNPCGFPPACIGKSRLSDGPTPPLVAASPVPPVVPDSEAQPLDCANCGHLKRHHDDDFLGCDYCSCRSSKPVASGVVPDKPALTPEAHTCPYHAPGICAISCFPSCPCRVPAVTDDEAATKALALALGNASATAVRDSQPPELRLMMKDRNERLASSLVAALRSAGFLIVHHTKET